MALKELLYNFPDNPEKGPGGKSKEIDFNWDNKSFSEPLVKRVSWDTTDTNAKPTFEGFGATDHNPTFGVIDSFVRGGVAAAGSRRLIDAERIFKFYKNFILILIKIDFLYIFYIFLLFIKNYYKWRTTLMLTK